MAADALDFARAAAAPARERRWRAACAGRRGARALAVPPSAGRAPHPSLVASVAGWRGLPQSLAYGPTKAALINLAENLFLDLRPKGVGVSLVNPALSIPRSRRKTSSPCRP